MKYEVRSVKSLKFDNHHCCVTFDIFVFGKDAYKTSESRSMCSQLGHKTTQELSQSTFLTPWKR